MFVLVFRKLVGRSAPTQGRRVCAQLHGAQHYVRCAWTGACDQPEPEHSRQHHGLDQGGGSFLLYTAHFETIKRVL
jgi:hypothetical protein